MLCPDSLRVQAYFDGEVDAVSAAEIERHLEHCSECRELYQSLQHTRRAIRSELGELRAPQPLRARLQRSLDAAERSERSPVPRSRPGLLGRAFWAGAFSGIGVSAIAVVLALFVLLPMRAAPLVNDLVGAHLRSLMPDHLIDVASSDRHTVKPWFAGHADVSPAVADFDSQGYRLVGGRADYIDHQRSAVLVYQHGAHVINVFSWEAGRAPVPQDGTHNGYHLLFWRMGDIDYCAVSDTAWDELRALQRLLRQQS